MPVADKLAHDISSMSNYSYSIPTDKIPTNVTKKIDDTVNHPAHYTNGTVECIAAIESSMDHLSFCGYLKGNIMKYLWRYDKKGKDVEDLKKAYWYLNKLITTVENS